MDVPGPNGGLELRWARVALFPAVYQLLWNDQELGQLAWEGLFSSRAVAVAGDGAWRIRRHGFLAIVIEDAASGEPVGEVQLRLRGAELTLMDGRQFALRRSGLLAWRLEDSAGSPVIQLRGFIGMRMRGGTCTVEPAAEQLPEARLLALLAMYVVIFRARQRARA